MKQHVFLNFTRQSGKLFSSVKIAIVIEIGKNLEELDSLFGNLMLFSASNFSQLNVINIS